MNFNRILFSVCCVLISSQSIHANENGSENNNRQPVEAQFTLVPESDSGVNFVSRLIPDHKYGYLYHSGMTCSGLAAGDLDGDGRPDLFLANGPGPNALYLQSGEGIHFDEVTSQAAPDLDGGDKWASGVSLADIDNDGDLDIYVCNYESPNQLFLNVGAKNDKRVCFEEIAVKAGVAVTDASHIASFCDYDADGDLDFFLLTNRVEDPRGSPTKLPVEFERPGFPQLLPGYERSYQLWIVDAENWGVEPVGRSDYLFRNDGFDADGNVTFTEVSKQSGIAGRGDGLSCLWWDADLDGDSDLYVCNDFVSSDRFYINNGDGTFTNEIAEAMPHTTWFSMGSNFGDIDNDGDFDMFVGDMAATSHYKSKVTMGIMGGMTLRRANASTPPQYMRNSLYLNEGERKFREGAYLAGLASSDWTWSVKMNDFDSDGRLDMFLTNGVPREMNHSDIVITEDMLAGKHMWEFFKDGEMRKEKNLAYRNNGGLNFEDVSTKWGLDHLGASYGAVTSDLDRDGDLDMVVMNLEENISIYRNENTSGSWLMLELQGSKANRFGIGATVTVESGEQSWIRHLTPCAGYHSYDEPILHFGLGDVEKIDRVTIAWPGLETQTLDDVKINQRIVVEQDSTKTTSQRQESKKWFVKSESLSDLWHQENVFDDFSLQPLLPHELSSEGPCMAWADVNGDNYPDVFVGGSQGIAGELRLGASDGSFRMMPNSVFADDRAGEDAAAQFADFDNDGDADLLVGRGSFEIAEGASESKNILYWNDGAGNFEKAAPGTIPKSATNSGTLAVADFDKDGDIDVFVGSRVRSGKYPLSNNSELWINKSGKFELATDQFPPEFHYVGMVTDANWCDVDGDKWLDLLIAREWDSVALFLNKNGTLEKKSGGELGERTGWWKALDTGDVDGDGDMDLIATNVGLNTKYKTSLKQPMTVYYGAFDDSGQEHIVEVKREGDVCYPERGRSCSSNAMPFIAKKFDTFHDFGLASLSDIYGDEKLGKAKRFEANTFQHAIFLNDGIGDFKFAPLEKVAQIAPSAAAKFADLDNDGDLDIVMGQNFHGPQSETSRYDGGLGQILTNDGQGIFAPLDISESGFWVRETVTAIKVLDTNNDGRHDIVVATNDGPTTVFLRNDEK